MKEGLFCVINVLALVLCMPTFLRVHVLFSCTKRERKVDLYVNSMVKEVLTNEEGKATGVAYINKEDRREYALKEESLLWRLLPVVRHVFY